MERTRAGASDRDLGRIFSKILDRGFSTREIFFEDVREFSKKVREKSVEVHVACVYTHVHACTYIRVCIRTRHALLRSYMYAHELFPVHFPRKSRRKICVQGSKMGSGGTIRTTRARCCHARHFGLRARLRRALILRFCHFFQTRPPSGGPSPPQARFFLRSQISTSRRV